MQTFLPFDGFQASAMSLDYRRLGKQRVEAYQILRTLTGRSDGWKNHPATKMWRGYEGALAEYGRAMCREWIARGYRDNLQPYFYAALPLEGVKSYPPWLGDSDFHRSHRANLVKKLPAFYVPIFGDLPWEPYVWPVT